MGFSPGAGGSGLVCKMGNSVQQAIASGVSTKVTLGEVLIDTHGSMGDTGNDRINIQEDGDYQVFANWGASVDDTEEVSVTVRVNGTSVVGTRYLASATNTLYGQPVGVFSLVAGDYVELYLFHTKGSNRNTQTSGIQRPTLAVVQA